MASADGVQGYGFLQTVRLRNNDLTDLLALGRLHSLTSLDVSGNKLTDVLRYSLPNGAPSMLKHADFSRNCVSSINSLSAFLSLISLRLAGNQVERVVGLSALSSLQMLDLSANLLTSCKGLEALVLLRELDLSGNQLSTLEPLSSLTSLVTLRAPRNKLVSTSGLGSLPHLGLLDVGHNRLESLHDLAHVAHLGRLCELAVAGNPLERFLDIRLHLVDLLPHVSTLDGVAVSAKEKVLSANMHGADAEARRTIRRRFFPNGELDDGGGAVLPTAAGLSVSRAEEEGADHGRIESEFARVDAAARGLAPGGASAWWRAAEAAAAVAAGHAAAAAAAAAGRTTPMSMARSSRSLVSLAEEGEGEEGEEGEGGWDASAAAAAARLAAPPALGASGDVGDGCAAPLLCLAEALAGACGAGRPHALLAHACWAWVAVHAAPVGRGATWSVSQPLFGTGEHAATAELALLGGAAAASSGDGEAPPSDSIAGRGAWAERAAWLFVQLARACELEAVVIPGYWKDGTLAPGGRLIAHNHCWAAVKVNTRWRLVDPTSAALAGGAPAAPFYVPPEAFLYSYWPFEAQWQLLPDPIRLDAWWALPEVDTMFFARGCQLVGDELQSVTELPSARQGEPLPALSMRIAWPNATPGLSLSHAAYDVTTGECVAEWPPRSGCGGGGGGGGGASSAQEEPEELAFQQPVYGRGSAHIVGFGAKSFPVQDTLLSVAFPRPGDYNVIVRHVIEVPGGVPVRLHGLDEPMRLRVVQADDVVRVRVRVPPPSPHDPEQHGILHSAESAPRAAPRAAAGFTQRRAQLVSPAPGEAIEADRTYTFEVVAPGCSRVALADSHGAIIAELTQVAASINGPAAAAAPSPPPTPPPPAARPGSGGSGARADSPPSPSPRAARPASPAAGAGAGPARFRADVVVPRIGTLAVVGLAHRADLGACGWEPLLSLAVGHQGQHIVHQPDEYDVVQVDPEDPAAQQAADMFRQMDLNNDSVVTRQEILVALRRNPHFAYNLKVPAKIALHDGTFDRFVDAYMKIDHDKLGAFTFSELCAYMGVRPSDESSSEGSSDGSDYNDDPDLDLDPEAFAEEIRRGSFSQSPVRPGTAQ
ncbi:hypothetical protein FOA52_004887 [Chlamydomonas sp. UWO 241]|nr:hypothetical protein FOA52_004887 [Chlamydomonas sp. UWO 241]